MYLMRSTISRTIVDDCVAAKILECARLEDGDEHPVARDELYAALLRDLLRQAAEEGFEVSVCHDVVVNDDNIVIAEKNYCDQCDERIEPYGEVRADGGLFCCRACLDVALDEN